MLSDPSPNILFGSVTNSVSIIVNIRPPEIQIWWYRKSVNYPKYILDIYISFIYENANFSLIAQVFNFEPWMFYNWPVFDVQGCVARQIGDMAASVLSELAVKQTVSVPQVVLRTRLYQWVGRIRWSIFQIRTRIRKPEFKLTGSGFNNISSNSQMFSYQKKLNTFCRNTPNCVF